MDSGLLTLLKDSKVPDAAIEFLKSKNLVSVHDLAGAIDTAPEVETKLLRGAAEELKEVAVVSRIKMAWRKAEADWDKAIKRGAEGLDAEVSDEPLAAEMQRRLLTSFQSHHGILYIDPRTICCNPQIGIFRREFEKFSPQPFLVLKIKTVAFAVQHKPAKKQKLTEDFYLASVKAVDHAEATVSGDLWIWLRLLKVMTFTWAVVGFFDHSFKPDPEQEGDAQIKWKYVGLSEILKYEQEI